MSVVLECDDMTSGYLGVPAVRKLCLQVHAGEVVALLGANGAGKTTTLLTLAGALAPISGHVRLLGEEVPAGRPHIAARRGLSFVPDDRSLFFGLTARENLRLGRVARGDDPVELVLEYFPALKSRLSARAGLLSGGEQQMLAIGRALVVRPKALMVDEMSLGLAPKIVKGLLPIMRRIANELGTAVLIVEQHVDLALSNADRAYILSHGSIVAEGAASQLASQRSVLEASYLGDAATA